MVPPGEKGELSHGLQPSVGDQIWSGPRQQRQLQLLTLQYTHHGKDVTRPALTRLLLQ